MLDGNGDGRNDRIVPFSSVASSASVELAPQTSKCEPVLTEAQAETSASLLPSLVRTKLISFCCPCDKLLPAQTPDIKQVTPSITIVNHQTVAFTTVSQLN